MFSLLFLVYWVTVGSKGDQESRRQIHKKHDDGREMMLNLNPPSHPGINRRGAESNFFVLSSCRRQSVPTILWANDEAEGYGTERELGSRKHQKGIFQTQSNAHIFVDVVVMKKEEGRQVYVNEQQKGLRCKSCKSVKQQSLFPHTVWQYMNTDTHICTTCIYPGTEWQKRLILVQE